MKAWLSAIAVLLVFAGTAAVIYVLRPPPTSVRLENVRNVILVSIDTLRADHVGAYGYERQTTPKLDAFARRGARFEKALSAASWTTPSHMTMLTGLEPPSHGAQGFPRPQRPGGNVRTLAEILVDHGFQTAAFTGGGYVSAKFGFNRGFEKFVSRGRHFTHNIHAARRWVRRHHKQPFFLFLHGYDVHKPYAPPKRYADLFSDGYQPSFDIRDLNPSTPRLSKNDLRFVISQYDAEIRAVDDLLGQLLSEWQAMGLLDETLVVITSDHGEEFYEHGQVYHGHALYDELLRVPLIVVGPGVVPGVYDRQVGVIDVTPTILGALGMTGPQRPMQGIDLTPVLAGQASSPERLLFSFLRYSKFDYSISAVRSEDWKLIAYDPQGLTESQLRRNGRPPAAEYLRKIRLVFDEGPIELFDLRNDPRESENVAAEHPEAREHFSTLLDARSSEEIGDADKGDMPVLDEKDIEALEALGYL